MANPMRKSRPRKKEVNLTPRQEPIPFAMEIAAILKPLDLTASEMERKWGFGRLEALVSEGTAQRFAIARQGLNDAIEKNNLQAISETAANMRRGWAALDAEATAQGQQPYDPIAWGFMVGDLKAAVVRDPAAAGDVQRLDPGTQVWTLEEIGNLIAAYLKDHAPAIAEARGLFPGATITVTTKPKPPPSPVGQALQDEIPF